MYLRLWQLQNHSFIGLEGYHIFLLCSPWQNSTVCVQNRKHPDWTRVCPASTRFDSSQATRINTILQQTLLAEDVERLKFCEQPLCLRWCVLRASGPSTIVGEPLQKLSILSDSLFLFGSVPYLSKILLFSDVQIGATMRYAMSDFLIMELMWILKNSVTTYGPHRII